MKTNFPIIRSTIVSILFALICTNSATAGFLGKNKTRVYVNSIAHEDYIEGKEAGSKPKAETYVFAEGRQFKGYIRDASLQDVTFNDLVENLSHQMANRNYHPASNSDEGDLLIIVHWGMTGVSETYEELMQTNTGGTPEAANGPAGSTDPRQGGNGGDLPSNDNTFIDSQSAHSNYGKNSTEYSEGMNASLLGFDIELGNDNINKNEEYTLEALLRTERYFIVLMAYDYQHLRETSENKLLWTTRFSMPTQGTNFRDAHQSLAKAAAPFYGTQLDKIQNVKTSYGDVELGDLQVVESNVDE